VKLKFIILHAHRQVDPPFENSSCQQTFDTLRKSVVKRKCASAKRARLGSDNVNSKTAHTDMTTEQQGEKLNQLLRQIKILPSKNYRLNLLKLASFDGC